MQQLMIRRKRTEQLLSSVFVRDMAAEAWPHLNSLGSAGSRCAENKAIPVEGIEGSLSRPAPG